MDNVVYFEVFSGENHEHVFYANKDLYINPLIKVANRKNLFSYLNAVSKSNYMIKSLINGDHVIYKAYLDQNNDVVSFEKVNYNLIKKLLMVK